MLAAADVLLVFCRVINPQHDKFVTCVCPERWWFFFINSKPWRRKLDAQVKIEPHELRCLDHTSWVDTSKIITFQDAELIPAMRDKARRKGQLSNLLRQRIKTNVETHSYLPVTQARAVQENL